MRWQRWRIAAMCAPAMVVIVVLFGGGLAYGFVQSLGWQPLIGRTELGLQSYARILFGERVREQFWTGLALSLWISGASTVISAVLAVAGALLLRRTFSGKRLATFVFQFNLPIPHVVAAVGILFVFSFLGKQTG